MSRARRRRREAPQQRAQALVLQLASLRVEAVLQWLDTIEHKQHFAPHHRFGNRLALGGGAGGFELEAELVASAQLRNSSDEIARSLVPWL
jgi:hypothetical protein